VKIPRVDVSWLRWRPWLPYLTASTAVLLVAAVPATLVPVARAFAALCARYPILALLTNHARPLPIALLVSLGFLALLIGGGAGVNALLATMQLNRCLGHSTLPAPTRLGCLAVDLGVGARLTYLAAPEPLVCCYGILRPRIAVSAGLIERLDDAELLAVLGHERAHLCRRDPLRYLLLDALAAAAFMFPVAAALRQRAEAMIELAADRAALAVAPRGALAGAMLAMLPTPRMRRPGIAGMTPSEARIAHLAGRPALPPIPARAVMASLGFVALVVLAMIDLTASPGLVGMACRFCPWLS
jgi:Zn-dependent protease with chaperone function